MEYENIRKLREAGVPIDSMSEELQEIVRNLSPEEVEVIARLQETAEAAAAPKVAPKAKPAPGDTVGVFYY